MPIRNPITAKAKMGKEEGNFLYSKQQRMDLKVYKHIPVHWPSFIKPFKLETVCDVAAISHITTENCI